jgi:hypothetical protein
MGERPMSDLMHRVTAISDLCVVNTFVYAENEEQAERMGLEQIADELGISDTDMFIDVEVECEEAQ